MPLNGESINTGRAYACKFADGASGTLVDEVASVTLALAGGATLSGTGVLCNANLERATVTTPAALKLTLPITIGFHGTAQGAPAAPSEYFGVYYSNNIATSPFAGYLSGVGGGAGPYKLWGNTAGTFSFLNSGTNAVSSGNICVIGQFTTSGYSIWVNGTLVGSDTTSRNNPTYAASSLLFLGDGWAANRNTNMLYREASIWSRVLTSGERASYEGDYEFGYGAAAQFPFHRYYQHGMIA